MKLLKNSQMFGKQHMKKSDIELSIIIVTFNTKEITLECLHSLLALNPHEHQWEIIVVDNHSTDGTVEAVKALGNKSIQIIPLSENEGFAKGNNVGIKMAKGNFILLLNSDTEVSQEAIPVAVSRLKQDNTIGAVTVKLVLLNGTIDPACHRGFPTPWAAFTYLSGLERLFPHTKLFSAYHQGGKNFNFPHPVDAISGAFFMMRREVIETVGLLDEQFFMYGEDLDYAYRMRQQGWKIFYDPGATVFHKKKKSGRENKNAEVKKKTTMYF